MPSPPPTVPKARPRCGEPRRVLVTGGAGFVGSHLVDALLKRGDEVIVMDNFFTGSQRNLEHLKGNPKFEIIRHDIVTPFLVEIDEVYHLACPASPIHYKFNPVKTIKTNVLGTMNALGLAKRCKAKFLLTSTSEVYGDPLEHPQTESYWGNVNPIGERACYDEGKRCAETLFFDYHRQHNVDVKVVRIFNTYGPNMNPNDGRVVSNFIVQALKGDDITIYGDGMQTRSFCYMDDLLAGMVVMMNSRDGFLGPVNIGNPKEFTMLELAEEVLKQVGGRSKLVYLPLPQDDPKQRKPDISLAQSELDWHPSVGLADGLVDTIAYFKRVLAN